MWTVFVIEAHRYKFIYVVLVSASKYYLSITTPNPLNYPSVYIPTMIYQSMSEEELNSISIDTLMSLMFDVKQECPECEQAVALLRSLPDKGNECPNIAFRLTPHWVYNPHNNRDGKLSHWHISIELDVDTTEYKGLQQ